ncbi:MAG: hypothetical protein WCD20_19530 [Rhodomicrobium sp.]
MNWKAILGAALIVIALSLAGGGVYAVHSLRQPKFDPETLCPLAGAKAVTLILIDKTDPLTATEQARVRSLIAAEAEAVQTGGRIIVKLLQQKEGASEAALATAADLCNPGAEGNPFFENPRRVAARYQSAFREPVEQALASVKSAGSAPASPIARTVQTSVEAAPESQRLKLILVSDLMEHTLEASAYNGSLSEAALRKAIPPSTQARLKGTEVRVLLLNRPRYAKQQTAAIAIWRSFFAAASGREPDFERP